MLYYWFCDEPTGPQVHTSGGRGGMDAGQEKTGRMGTGCDLWEQVNSRCHRAHDHPVDASASV